jgi:hypothetical protein
MRSSSTTTSTELQYYNDPHWYSSTPIRTWWNEDVVLYKGTLLLMGQLEFFFFIPIFIMYLAGFIPSFPMDIFHYAAIYYLIMFPCIAIVNSIMSFQRHKELFALFALPLNVFVCVVTGYLTGVIWWQLYLCWTNQSSDTECRNTQTAAIITGVFTSILFVITFLVMLVYFALLSKIRRSNSVKTIVRRVKPNK